MRYSIFTMLMFVGWACLGQSKKEQIRVLTSQVDSLNLVLNAERTNNSLSVKQLNKRISQLEENVRGLELKLKEKNSENETNKKQIKELSEFIKIKSDSLTAMKAEIEKLKPTPKPVVQNKPIEAVPLGPYKTVTIGTQVWMKENLNVSTFRNGDPIHEAKTAEEWEAAGEAKQAAWCYYDNDPKNGTKYGKLYNWYAVNDPRGLAPVGWHVPLDKEWTVLEDFLGGSYESGNRNYNEGNSMKSTNGWNDWKEDIQCYHCKNWNNEYRNKRRCDICLDTRIKGKKTNSGNGNNNSGFSGLPSGYRGKSPEYGVRFEDFGDIREQAYWWSLNYSISCRNLSYEESQLFSLSPEEQSGLSVRCIKD